MRRSPNRPSPGPVDLDMPDPGLEPSRMGFLRSGCERDQSVNRASLRLSPRRGVLLQSRSHIRSSSSLSSLLPFGQRAPRDMRAGVCRDPPHRDVPLLFCRVSLPFCSRVHCDISREVGVGGRGFAPLEDASHFASSPARASPAPQPHGDSKSRSDLRMAVPRSFQPL